MKRKYLEFSKISVRSPKSAKSLSEFVDRLQESGRYTFVREEALRELHLNAASLKKAVMRLAAKARIVVPRRGFYAIVPVEYRLAGAPPPTWFIDGLMAHLGRPYYAGLLSAAALYGAAHQQPQEFQVITDRPQRLMRVGRSRIRFFVKKNMGHVVIEEHKTETGIMRVSTPEATAIDLLRYTRVIGGLSHAATVLVELVERIDRDKLAEAAKAEGDLAAVQRLGYILENVGAERQVSILANWINERSPRNIPLNPAKSMKGHPVNRRWRIVVNDTIERDI
jgi:predicted transcriptional regulator of viral defense system